MFHLFRINQENKFYYIYFTFTSHKCTKTLKGLFLCGLLPKVPCKAKSLMEFEFADLVVPKGQE